MGNKQTIFTDEQLDAYQVRDFVFSSLTGLQTLRLQLQLNWWIDNVKSCVKCKAMLGFFFILYKYDWFKIWLVYVIPSHMWLQKRWHLNRLYIMKNICLKERKILITKKTVRKNRISLIFLHHIWLIFFFYSPQIVGCPFVCK